MLNLWSLFINWGTKFLIPSYWIIEKNLCQILCVVLECFVREGLGCFSQPNILPKVIKITDLPKVSKNEQVGTILTCPKKKNDHQFWIAQSQQNDQFENLYISSHGEARNIKLGQQVNLIQRVQLGTPHQEVVTSLPHNHVTLSNLLYV